MSFLCLAIAACCVIDVSGHGQLTVPLPRPDIDGNPISYRQREPIFSLNGPAPGYSPTAMRCHDYKYNGETLTTTLIAGQTTPITWNTPAGHRGECYLYMSYDCNGKTGPCDPTNFFKIAAFPGCGHPGTLPLETTINTLIPAALPACDHCVLRWEWTGHHQVTSIEFYAQCADIKIQSTAASTLPSPTVAISGVEHLPRTIDGYRRVFDVGPSEAALFGPAVATYTTCQAGSSGCLTGNTETPPAATQAPVVGGTTNAPVVSPSGDNDIPTTCGDIEGFVNAQTKQPITCAALANYCMQWTDVYIRCQKTCGVCGANAERCVDTSPPVLFYQTGKQVAQCEDVKQHCGYQFVKRACPATCDSCAAVPNSKDYDLYSSLLISDEDIAAQETELGKYPLEETSSSSSVVVGVVVGLLLVAAVAAVVVINKRRAAKEATEMKSNAINPHSSV